MLSELLKPLQRVGLRRCRLSCEAKHPHHPHQRSLHPHNKQHTKKKRDISTSFRKGPVPRPLVNTPKQSAKEDEEIFAMPPPTTAFPSVDLTDLAAASFVRDTAPDQLWQGGQEFSDLAEFAWTSKSRADTQPVVAVAAATTSDLLQQDLLLSMDGIGASTDSQDGLLWSEGDQDADPLATLDRVLDSLLVAPPPPQVLKSHKFSNNKSSADVHTISMTPDPLASQANTVAHPRPSSSRDQARTSSTDGLKASRSVRDAPATIKSSSAGQASKSLGHSPVQPMAAAAHAAPAVTTIRCETEYERELQAAVALQQLLVVKVESSHHLLQGAHDSSLRFQTHTNLPPQLNAYLPHTDMPHTYRFSSSNSSSNTSNTAEVLASMGVPLGAPASSPLTGAPHNGLFGQNSSSSNNTEPFSPVHAWYKQMAARYAHSAAAAGRVSPVRFLSLQCEGGRCRSVSRRLGVSSPLAVVLVDPTCERKLQEVCGTKIEQELPYGLLYFGGVDQQGVAPSERLRPLDTAADLQALRSRTPWSVAVMHAHGAPPCVRSYGRLHALTQQLTQQTAATGAEPAVSFGVMDVDVCAEGAEVSRELDLQQLPTYIIYKDGQEVTRLTASADRRRLPEVLAEHMAAAASSHV